MPKFMNKQVVYLLIATKEINSSKLQAELSAKFTETNFKDYNYQESFKYDNTLIIAVGHLHEGNVRILKPYIIKVL